MKPTPRLPPTSLLRSSIRRPAPVLSQWLRPSVPRRGFLRPPKDTTHRAVENLNVESMRNASRDYQSQRRNFLLVGSVAGLFATIYTAYLLKKELGKQSKVQGQGQVGSCVKHMDSGLPAGADPFTVDAGEKRKTVLHDEEGREIVPTGHGTVTSFPRILEVAKDTNGSPPGAEIETTEYTLVGLGMRTVSFLSIQVYLVGYYVATQDIAAIQSRLVKEINPIASTLIPTEKEQLRQALLDPEKGEQLWQEILREVRPRSVFRIAPVRDTDFHHLRDGFVRAITMRSNSDKEYADDVFAESMKEFRAMFNRGKVLKGREMLLSRDEQGRLTVVFDDGKTGRGTIGRVADERLSRALWLNYLAGSKVASEPARKNIVEGIMEFVERPVGTVAAQVV